MSLQTQLPNRNILSSDADRLIRAYLKIHFRHLHATLCGIFAPNSGYIARYAPFIRDQSPTNCDAHLTESNFQTLSSVAGRQSKIYPRHLRPGEI